MLTQEENDRRLELIAKSCGEGLSKEEKIGLANLQRGAQPHISCPEVFERTHKEVDSPIEPSEFLDGVNRARQAKQKMAGRVGSEVLHTL